MFRTTLHEGEDHEDLARRRPLGRMGEVTDVVDAVLQLEDAPFVTGAVLHVDGGRSAGH
nr:MULTISPECIES: SDR family oxidoreductase [unclassified Streptomyces]